MFLFKRTFSLYSCQTTGAHVSTLFTRSNGQIFIVTVTVSGPLNEQGVVIPYNVVDNVIEGNLKERFKSDPTLFENELPIPTLEKIADFLFSKFATKLASSIYAGTHTLESIEIVPKSFPDIKIERRKD